MLLGDLQPSQATGQKVKVTVYRQGLRQTQIIKTTGRTYCVQAGRGFWVQAGRDTGYRQGIRPVCAQYIGLSLVWTTIDKLAWIQALWAFVAPVFLSMIKPNPKNIADRPYFVAANLVWVTASCWPGHG